MTSNSKQAGDASDDKLIGVVEGFYGREWDWGSRREYAGFLKSLGLNSFLYCPKSDSVLRKQWQEDWSAADREELGRLALHYRDLGLNWGVGLSPFALYRDYSAAARRLLKEKIARIDDLGGNILAVLFDDMPGDCPDLAARQAEIIADVKAWSGAGHILACGTYYSSDPVLEQHFGTMPERYQEDLGERVDPEVGLFWTGNRVCSETITPADLDKISGQLRRAPVLWDNYPVNDGAKASKYLHMAPLPGRDPALPDAVSGHFCNPMNQAGLSRYPLTGLAALYGHDAPGLEALYSPDFAARLADDQALFEQTGLDGLGDPERARLAGIYDRLDDPAAAEVAGWLRGEYAFDPACLTG